MRRILMLVGALVLPAPALRAQQLVATRSSLVHLLPAAESRRIGAIRSGEQLVLLTQVNGYDRVLLPNHSVGWVDSTDVHTREIAPPLPVIPATLRVAVALEPRITPALSQTDATAADADAVQAIASRAQARDDSTSDGAPFASAAYSLASARTPEPSEDLAIVQQGAPESAASPLARNAALMFGESLPALQTASFVRPLPSRGRSWLPRRESLFQPISFVANAAAPAMHERSRHAATNASDSNAARADVDVDSAVSLSPTRRGNLRYRAMPFAAMLRLPLTDPGRARGDRTDAQDRKVAGHDGAPVSVDGYIVAWETATPAEASGEPTGAAWHDWRLWLVRTEDEASRRDRSHAIIVQLAQRTRGPNADRSEMVRIRHWARDGRRVRVSGPLRIRTEAGEQPGPRPATPWEIAPVAEIEPAP